ALLREFVADLEPTLVLRDEQVREIYAPRIGGLDAGAAGDVAAHRAAWNLVAQWLVAVSLGRLDRSSTVRDAEAWFLADVPSLPRIAPPASVPPITASLAEMYALLPYLLDPRSQGTRRMVLHDPKHLSDR